MRELLPIPSVLAGVAGEYYVAAELSRRGYIASISLRNTRGVDIHASNHEGTKSVTIQVKTNQTSAASWIVNEKAESFASKDHFYVFVRLSSMLDRASYFVVPSRIVAKRIKSSHQKWLSTSGRNGRVRKDTPMRKFEDAKGEFLEKWELLGLGDWFAQYWTGEDEDS